MAKCIECGREFTPREPHHKRCDDCHRKGRSGVENRMNFGPASGRSSPPGGGAPPPRNAPVIKDSFYGEDGFLKREIFLEAAQDAANAFTRDKMTQTSFRRLFDMLKSAEMRLRTDRDKEQAFGHARETFHKFVVLVEYQHERGIIKTSFLAFIRAHTDLASKNAREFRGFVEYLTSILARLRAK